MLKYYFFKALAISKADDKTAIKYKSIYKFLWHYLKPYKRKFIIVVILLILLSILSLPAPYLTKYLIDDVIQRKQFGMLNIIIVLMLLLVVIKIFFSFIMDYMLTIISQKVINSVRYDLFNKIIKLPMDLINRTQTGYLVSRISEVQQIRTFFFASYITASHRCI